MRFDRSILLLGVVALASACTPTAQEACLGYCRSEIECSMIGNSEAEGCQARCESQLSHSTPQCDEAFRNYASCYDESSSCKAADCFESFTSFADNCSWYAAEIALSTGDKTAQADTQVRSPSGG